ncbi:MAG TPA: FHA domain-containing protein [Vicinamibacteria bacterium]|nr:FHA domain-containing protein [Vicinamibacteria bacterium]
MSRSVWLRDEAAREGFQNDATVCVSAIRAFSRHRSPAPRSFEGAFRRHYAAIRRLLNAHRSPGLALAVAGGEQLEATAWVAAEEEGINPVIVGRHSMAELFLPSDPELSLRHLAVILHRRGVGPGRFRILDLRTPSAFEDEQGRRLEALESTGPTLVRCASFGLLLLPTGEGDEPWPEDPDAGCRRVPHRVYLDSTSADPERWSRPGGVVVRFAPAWNHEDGQATSVITFPGPIFLAPTPADAGPAQGEIRVSARSGVASLLLDREAARRGTLLGRYERCDGAGLPCLSSLALSRVHLLVVESGGTLWAIDTASKNGTWEGDRRLRRARLDPGRRLRLAADATVEWCPFH